MAREDSSVLFAFTFLILFMLLAVGGVIALLGVGQLLLQDSLVWEESAHIPFWKE